MSENNIERLEAELGTLRSYLAKACHVNRLDDYELKNLISLVNDYEGTRLLLQEHKNSLKNEKVGA